MGLFSKGKSRDQLIAEAAELNVAPVQEEKKEDASTGNAKIDIELAKIRGQIEGLSEARKATGERFTRISEQVGELRGMIVDTNKMMSKVEVSSTKAIDLVDSVHPEKLMIEVRRQDGKIEALRAGIESNEAIMRDVMLEMKKMRNKMSFYKGLEQVMAMNEEVKHEIATIKRIEANVGLHADKIDTIFLEVEKKFAEFDKFNDVVKDLDKTVKKTQSDFEKIRVHVEMKLERKDFLDLLDKFNDFEKHTTNLLKLLDERNKTMKDELNTQFKGMEIEYRKKLDGMKIPVSKASSQNAQKSGDDVKEPTAQPSQGPPGVDASSGPSGEDGAGKDASSSGGMLGKFKGLFGKKE